MQEKSPSRIDAGRRWPIAARRVVLPIVWGAFLLAASHPSQSASSVKHRTSPGSALGISTPPAGWDSVLANVEIQGDVVVPSGETWLIGPNVRIAGNLRTDSGTIAMRPGSSLHFIGADPQRYVGGGMGYEPRFAQDIGLWIGTMGVLDIRGTPKTGWNRTGEDPTWKRDDEYWIAPTEPGNYQPRRWHPGEPIPQVDPRVPPAEVINVTRDILIEGPAHIHIHSRLPQRIEYVTLRRMGIGNRASRGPVKGRYALHIHHGGDGTRGTIIRGVAAVASGGRVFVPHESNGITFEDVVSVNSYGEGFWWDIGDRSDDIVVDRLAVIGVHMPRDRSGRTSMHSAIVLGGGTGIAIRNSVAAGARGSKISHGFEWPSRADNHGPAVWEFNQGNVAHNDEGSGIRLWFNNSENHVIANAVTYRNGYAGVENGAYRNAHRYENLLLFEDRLVQHASSRPQSGDGHGARFENVTVIADRGAALNIGRLRLPPMVPTEFVDCKLVPGDGAPKVSLDSDRAANAFIAVFRNCDLSPEDIQVTPPFAPGLAGTRIVLEDGDGPAWEITLDMKAGKKVVRELDPMASAAFSTAPYSRPRSVRSSTKRVDAERAAHVH